VRAQGRVVVAHCSAYRCNTLFSQAEHDLSKFKRCTKVRITTGILDAKVIELIEEIMFNPVKLSPCIDGSDRGSNEGHGTQSRADRSPDREA
jgi:hypothetical protein